MKFWKSLKNPVVGTLIAFAAAWSFALMGFCVRRTTGEVPALWVVFVRSATGAVLLTPFAIRKFRLLLRSDSHTIWLRAFAGSGSSLFYFWNLQHSSVSEAGVLLNLSPLLVAIFSWFALGERLSKQQMLGIGVTLCGLLAVGLNPDSHIGTMVFASGFLGAILGAIAFTALRHAANRYSTTLVVWTYMISGCILTIFIKRGDLLTWLGSAYTDRVSSAHLWALGSGICGLLGQIFLTFAFFSLEAAVASTLSLTSVLWGAVLDVELDGRHLGMQSWIAYGVVILGAAVLQRSTVKKKSRETIP